MSVEKIDNTSSKPFGGVPLAKEEVPPQGPPGTAPQKIQRISSELDVLEVYQDVSPRFHVSPRSVNLHGPYDADESNPMLYAPDETETPKPYGRLERWVILQALVKEMKKSLEGQVSAEEMVEIISSVIDDLPLTNDKHAQLAKKHGSRAIATIKKEGRLPEKWAPTSTAPQDWTPLPVQPYGEEKKKEINDFYDEAVEHAFNSQVEKADPPLTMEQIALLKKAISTGHVSSEIGEAYISITKRATTVTQDNFGLPTSWVKGTVDVESWKPINAGIVNSTSVAGAAQTEYIVENLDKLQQGMTAALEKYYGIMPEGMRSDVVNYLKTISQTILMMQEQLAQTQIADSQGSKNLTGAKFDALENKIARGKAMEKKRAEIKKQQEKQKKWGWFFKIFSIIVAAIVLTFSAAAMLTGGGTPLAIAGFAVAAAMLTYTCVDAALDVTTTIAKAVDEWIKTIAPENASPLTRALIKLLMVSVMVIVLVIVAVAAPGLIASQVVAQVIKQLAISAAIMTVMSSNVITELVGEVCKAAGLDEKETMAAQIIMSTVTALGMMAGMALGRGWRPSFQGAKESLLAMRDALVDLGKTLKNSLINTLNIIKNINLQDTLGSIKSFNAWEGLKTFANRIKEIQLNSETLVKVARVGHPVSVGLGLGVEIAGGVMNGVLLLQLSRMASELGDEKAATDFLQTMITLMEKLMQTIQEGMSNAGDMWQEAGTFITEFFTKASQSRSRFLQSSAA